MRLRPPSPEFSMVVVCALLGVALLTQTLILAIFN